MAEDEVQATTEDELLAAPARGSADELLDAGAADHYGRMRHSAAHVMAEAVMRLFPGVKLGIGPAIEDGFYYDFLLERPLTPADLAAIEQFLRRRQEGRLSGLLLAQIDASNRIATTFGHERSEAFTASYAARLRGSLQDGTASY